jgi:hypothetical protein
MLQRLLKSEIGLQGMFKKVEERLQADPKAKEAVLRIAAAAKKVRSPSSACRHRILTKQEGCEIVASRQRCRENFLDVKVSTIVKVLRSRMFSIK